MEKSKLLSIPAALVILAFLGLFAVVAGAAEKPDDPKATALTEPLSHFDATGPRPDLPSARDECDGKWQGDPAFVVHLWFQGDESYAVYQDPIETGCPNTYPFGVTEIVWTVDVYSPMTLNVEPVLFENVGTTECPEPGDVICSGGLRSYAVPPGGWIIHMSLDDTCCVDEPYFAGVIVPTYYGAGVMDIVVDSGTTPPPLICRAYNDYGTGWRDLVDDVGITKNLSLWSVGYNSDQNACPSLVIVPGPDLWETPANGATVDSHFIAEALPSDFFGPGSDPFDGVVALQGSPLVTSPGGVLGTTDAIVSRLDTAVLSGPGSSTEVPVQMTALSLTSMSPITVSYDNGAYSEQWQVDVCLSSEADQPPGTINIVQYCEHGGSFEATFAVIAKLIFSRIDPPPVDPPIVLDPPGGLAPDTLYTLNGRWTDVIPPPFSLWTSPGDVHIDHDCEPGTPNIIVGPASGNFFPGMTVEPCDSTNPGP